MKLGLKLTCITLACTLAALLICLGVFTIWHNDRIISTAEEQAHSSFRLFYSNLESLNNAAPGSSVSDLTSRSIVHYYFATYAHLLGNNAYFSLVQDSDYLYNTCPIDPKALLENPESTEQVSQTIVIDEHYYVIAQPLHVLSQDYVVYLVMNISSAYEQVRDTYSVSAIMLVLSVLIVVCITVPSIRHTLKPLAKLRETAERIAEGEYHLRVQVESKDEVGSLTVSFNGMADAVESRIDALTEESERRRLLLGALAHELKTPMTAIIGFAGSMLKTPLSEEQRQHSLQQILSAGQRTERMTQKLMTLLSMDGEGLLEKQLISLKELANELAHIYPSDVHFIAEGELWADHDLLISLVQNLMNNAMNASAAHIHVTMTPDKIQVSDDGRGIPAEHIARLAEPFYRVDKARSRKHGGAGLGPALCQNIAKAHDGIISIESVVGEGTTYLTNVQRFEPFVWCYADDDSILLSALTIGRIITVFILTLGYSLMILLSSMAMCIGCNVFAGNQWSETAAMLSYAPGSFEVAISVMRKTVKLTTPYGCAIQIFSLMFQYVLLMAMIQLAFTVLKSRKAGIMAGLIVNFAGYILTPDRFMTWLQLPQSMSYYANLLSAWLSALQHATYVMHSFGYDLLPRLHTSYLILGGATGLLIAFSALVMRRFQFNFTGGYSDE